MTSLNKLSLFTGLPSVKKLESCVTFHHFQKNELTCGFSNP